MLSKKEKEALKIINAACLSRNSCLIVPEETAAVFDAKLKVDTDGVVKILETLNKGGYIDCILAENVGRTVYCVTLLSKGKNYLDEKKDYLKQLYSRLIIAAACAGVSFIVGRLLYVIFS